MISNNRESKVNNCNENDGNYGDGRASHGGDIYSKREIKYGSKLVDFSANINPLGMPQEIKAAIIDNIDNYACYPDSLSRELRKEIAKTEKTVPQNILCGNGAADIIFRLVMGLKPRKALLLAPTFTEYEQAVKAVGCSVEYYNLSEKNGFIVEDNIVEVITNKIDIMFICNPNNPTGVATKKELMVKILDKCSSCGVTLVVDECFIDFVNEEGNYSISSYIEDYDNLVIVKAFTKVYAMAGIRLGYMTCSNQGIISKVNNVSQPWSVSTVASECGIVALTLDEYVKKTKLVVRKNAEYLVTSLRGFGFKTYNSSTNYILFYCHDSMIGKKLEQYGILIRDCRNYHNLEQGFFRIAVKAEEDNQYLIECIEKVVKETET